MDSNNHVGLALVLLIPIVILLVLLGVSESERKAKPDQIKDIRRIGMTARREMDKICDEFTRQDLEQILSDPTRDST